MFFQTKTTQSTANYLTNHSANLTRLKTALTDADAIVVGAGAGFSTSAGLQYGGERFLKYFADFGEKYGFSDMYSGAFYPFPTLEEKWAYFSRMIDANRYNEPVGKPYEDLLSLLQDRDYFVITTNADHKFLLAGFDKQRLFYVQGDYGLWQCSVPCRQEVVENKAQVKQMVQGQKDMKIPSELIPYCQHCGEPMTMNLRADDRFVQPEGWYNASRRYADFLAANETRRVLYLELGIGNNTPAIIKYPFWRFTTMNPQATYACLNKDNIDFPAEIAERALGIQGDIGEVFVAMLDKP